LSKSSNCSLVCEKKVVTKNKVRNKEANLFIFIVKLGSKSTIFQEIKNPSKYIILKDLSILLYVSIRR